MIYIINLEHENANKNLVMLIYKGFKYLKKKI